jgi:Protein tyrosine phosphatase-like protein, PTPLA
MSTYSGYCKSTTITKTTQNDTMERSDSKMTQGWLIVTNALMMLAWASVLVFLIGSKSTTLLNYNQDVCDASISSCIKLALYISFLELFNSIIGVTKSKPQQVLLFSIIRFGVETIVTPQLKFGCSSWQHIFTVICWSFGDTIRFGCFLFDIILTRSKVAKSIRYTIGPILFPLGTMGEMLMVIAVANQAEVLRNKILIFGAASLWPVGFFYLFKQLLRQRRKFFRESKVVKVKV